MDTTHLHIAFNFYFNRKSILKEVVTHLMASSINKMTKNLVLAQTHYNPLQIQYCQNIVGSFSKTCFRGWGLFVSALKYTEKCMMRENSEQNF